MPTVTSQIVKRMTAIQKDRKETLGEMAGLSRQAGKRHDAIVDKLNGIPDDHPGRPALEEVRDGLRAATEFCRSTIEQQTGAPPQEPVYHGSRNEAGKFAQTNSSGHMMRRMQGKP